MRIAFLDLMFSWPPNGGADVDTYEVLRGLHARGVELKLFVLSDPGAWERGRFEPEALPFPVEKLTPPGKHPLAPQAVTRLFQERVGAFAPDVVWGGFGLFLKPYVLAPFVDKPLVWRFYAHELICHKDTLRFKHGAPCPMQYLETPDVCRRCALHYLGPDLRAGRHGVWLGEYLAAQAWKPAYHARLKEVFAAVDVAVVSNKPMRETVAPFCRDAVVLPGGVDLARFAFTPPPERGGDDLKRIVMAGRAEDPAKGLGVLLDAARILRETRRDFEVLATAPEDMAQGDWFIPTGWQSQEEVATLYADADVCVVPSLWEEPFGLVAVEAMAVGRPVCAARVGGLQHIVVDGDTGLLHARGDAAELARQLERLLDDAALRKRMGEAGRRRVEARYTWEAVLDQHYVPLLEWLEGLAAP